MSSVYQLVGWMCACLHRRVLLFVIALYILFTIFLCHYSLLSYARPDDLEPGSLKVSNELANEETMCDMILSTLVKLTEHRTACWDDDVSHGRNVRR